MFGTLLRGVQAFNPTFERPARLLMGAFHLALSNFDHAFAHWEAFAGSSAVDLAAVRAVGLVARLVLEDGAVADRDGAIRAGAAMLVALPQLDTTLYAAVLDTLCKLCRKAQEAQGVATAAGNAASAAVDAVAAARPAHAPGMMAPSGFAAIPTVPVKLGMTEVEVPLLPPKALDALDRHVQQLVADGDAADMDRSMSLSILPEKPKLDLSVVPTAVVEAVLTVVPFLASNAYRLLDTEAAGARALPRALSDRLPGFAFLMPDEVHAALEEADRARTDAQEAVDHFANDGDGSSGDDKSDASGTAADAIAKLKRAAEHAAPVTTDEVVGALQDAVIEQADDEMELALQAAHGSGLGSLAATELELRVLARAARCVIGQIASAAAPTNGSAPASPNAVASAEDRLTVLGEALDVLDAAVAGLLSLLNSPTLAAVIDVLLKIMAEAEEAKLAFDASVTGRDTQAVLAAVRSQGDSELAQKLALCERLKEILTSAQPGPPVFFALLQALADAADRGGAKTAEEAGAPTSVSVSVRVEGISGKDLQVVRLLVGLARGEEEALPGLLQLTGTEVSPDKVKRFTDAMRVVSALRGSSAPGTDGKSGSAVASDTAKDMIRVVAQSIFDELDEDRSGLLSFEEFKTALVKLRIQVPEHEARMAFAELDVDKSGKLSLDEFQTAIKTIRSRYLQRMLDHLNLTREAVYITTVWTVVFLLFFTTFLLLGFIGFTDGQAFTAATTALMPLLAAASGAGKDGAAQMAKLYNKIDDLVAAFFEVLSKTSVGVDVETA